MTDWCAMRSWWVLALASLLGWCVPAQAALPSFTVLEYPILNTVQAASSFDEPSSVFHSQELVVAQALAITEAWKTEPLTVPWTRVALERYVKHKMSPTRGARGLALLHVAMHDALVLALQQNVDKRLAVSMAAAQVLGYLFVTEEKMFDRIALAIAGKRDGALPTSAWQAFALGKFVGQMVVAHGETDGAQKGWNGVRLQYYGEDRFYGPGTWEPTPPYFYYPPDEPFAPQWRPWIIATAGVLRPQPPAYGSLQYLKDLQEVVDVSEHLTPGQLKIAKFWIDGHGSVTPPGHWNQIAMDAVKQMHLDEQTTARLFAVLNVALADTFIAVWDSKYFHWTARPVTAAKHIFGKNLQSAILTPPFPSYVSGHAGFSGAAARVLGVYFPARAKVFNDMAEEAAMSRLYGGIHFRHDNEDGLTLGRRVADVILDQLNGRNPQATLQPIAAD